jgi:hypothetical protein
MSCYCGQETGLFKHFQIASHEQALDQMKRETDQMREFCTRVEEKQAHDKVIKQQHKRDLAREWKWRQRQREKSEQAQVRIFI